MKYNSRDLRIYYDENEFIKSFELTNHKYINKTAKEIMAILGERKIKTYSDYNLRWIQYENEEVQLSLSLKDNNICYKVNVYWLEPNPEKRLYEVINNRATLANCDKYFKQYPNGMYKDDVLKKKDHILKKQKQIKQEKVAKAKRDKLIKTNSNKYNWKLGDKICRVDYKGITMGTIDQWNSDKSKVKIKIAASPGGLYDGDLLTKGNEIWITPKGWHKCLDDEKKYALENDRSADFENYSRSNSGKKGKFDVGVSVQYKFQTSTLGLWTNDYYIKGVVNGWNSDFTKMRIKVSATNYEDPSDDRAFNGQTFYRGNEIWVSPYRWTKM